jgi:CRISPR-associated protein Cas2
VEFLGRLQTLLNLTDDHLMIIDVGPAENVEPRVQSLSKRGFDVIERKPIIV